MIEEISSTEDAFTPKSDTPHCTSGILVIPRTLAVLRKRLLSPLLALWRATRRIRSPCIVGRGIASATARCRTCGTCETWGREGRGGRGRRAGRAVLEPPDARRAAWLAWEAGRLGKMMAAGTADGCSRSGSGCVARAAWEHLVEQPPTDAPNPIIGNRHRQRHWRKARRHRLAAPVSLYVISRPKRTSQSAFAETWA